MIKQWYYELMIGWHSIEVPWVGEVSCVCDRVFIIFAIRKVVPQISGAQTIDCAMN